MHPHGAVAMTVVPLALALGGNALRVYSGPDPA